MKRIRGFNIEDIYYKKLQKIAEANKRSCSSMVEVLIDLYEKMTKGVK